MATRTTTPSSTLHDHDNEKKPSVEGRPEAETLDAPDASATQEEGDLEKKPAAAPPVGFQVPDGGLDAWLVVAGGWLVLFSTFGFVSGFGVLQVYYVRALERNDSAVSWIGSFQLWLQFTAGLVVGKLFDEGYGRYLLWFGSALYIFCLYMVSLTKEYWQVFLAQGLGAGIGLGVLFLPAISVIPQWFSRKRATATGIVVSGSSIGGICFPIMLNKLIESHGFPYAMRAAAYTVTGCLFVASFLIRFRLPGRKHRPPHMQLPPPDMKGIMRHTTYWITGVAAWFIMAGLFFPIFFLQAFAEINGIDSNLAFYLLSILNAASFFGRIIPNVLADKLGNFNMVIAACAVGAILNFVMPLCTSKGAVIVLAILYGFCSGAYVSLIPGCIASLSSHVGEIGVRMGIAWAFVATASLIGPPIDGALLGTAPDFHWWPPVAWAGTVVAVGTLFMAWARTRLAHEKGTWRV